MGKTVKYNINLFYITSLLLIVFSGFYLTRILPVSPVYLLFIIAIMILSVGVLIRKRINYEDIVFTPYYFIAYLCLTQVFLAPDVSTFINVFFSLLYLVFMPIALPDLSRVQLVRISIYFIKFSVVLMGVEAAYRITHPIFFVPGSPVDHANSEDLIFYAYKMNSIMFLDSNFVGLYGLTVFFLAHYINKFHQKINIIWLLLLVGLIAATISRAAIISLIMTLVLVWIVGYKLPVKRVFILVVLGLILMIAAIGQFANDASLQSKFMIIELTQQYLERASISNLLFGIGLGNTKLYLDIGAHNFFVAYLMETGILGLILQVSIIIELFVMSKTRAWPIILSFIVAGLSLAGHAVTSLYAAIILVIILERKVRKETSETKFSFSQLRE